MDRVCNKAYQLTENLTIEPGTPVYVNVVAIHHNEDYYPEPEEWKPERFINSTDSDNHDFTFLPFGEGPRFCIGILDFIFILIKLDFVNFNSLGNAFIKNEPQKGVI